PSPASPLVLSETREVRPPVFANRLRPKADFGASRGFAGAVELGTPKLQRRRQAGLLAFGHPRRCTRSQTPNAITTAAASSNQVMAYCRWSSLRWRSEEH